MKRFLKRKLEHYSYYLKQNLPILKKNGEIKTIVNFDFDENANEFLENFEEINEENQEFKESELLKSRFENKESGLNDLNLIDSIKLNDKDIEEFL
jgi:hypothetical protein